MNNHKIEVVPVILEPHGNADKLSIVRVFGYTVVVNTQDWQGISQAAFIIPDSLVPITHEKFSFLAKTTSSRYDENCLKTPSGNYVRITVRKFRGVMSYGLLVPISDEFILGDNVAEVLGVLHYNPPEPLSTGGEATSGPNVFHVKYDVASFQRYAHEVFTPGEPTVVLEKIHGCNGKWVFSGGKIHCGSRTEWKRESESNLWWKVLRSTQGFTEWLEQHPDILVYGEVYGQQNLHYGTKPGEVRLAVFDLMQNGQWLNFTEARSLAKELPWVPVLSEAMPFDFNALLDLAEGPSLIPGANHFREGIVIKPLQERQSESVGRVQLKIVSPSYLEKC